MRAPARWVRSDLEARLAPGARDLALERAVPPSRPRLVLRLLDIVLRRSRWDPLALVHAVRIVGAIVRPRRGR